MFESLDYLYVPADDVDAEARRFVDDLGAELVWKIRGMDTVVACLRVSATGPAILLSGHLESEAPILVYRVADYAAAVERLRAAGLDVREIELQSGPCAIFTTAAGRRLAVYQLVRPGVVENFAGRIDEEGGATGAPPSPEG